MSLLENFPHTVSHQTLTYAQSSGGGDQPTPTTAYAGVSAWIQSASHNEVLRYAKRDMVVTHTVLLLPTDAQRMAKGDRLLVTAGPTHVGSSFEIKSLGERTAGLGRMWAAAVEELET